VLILALLRFVSGPLGYLALAGLVAAESTGIPVPGETALVAAAILARHGRFQIGVVIAVAAAAAIVGDNVGYLLGRKGGRALLERPGPLEDRRRRFLAEGEPFFQRHGAKAVFFGRWIAGLRIAAAWLAGINRMRWPVFLFWNALGGIAWATTVGLLSYLLGPTVERILKAVGYIGVGAAVLVAVAFFVVRRRRSGR
jgi:membrane protein DedA with SNARE-associated domain